MRSRRPRLDPARARVTAARARYDVARAAGWVAVAGAAVALLAAPPSARAQSLSGVVYDSTLAAPLAGAEVRLPETGRRTVTDERGGFRFEGLTPGRHAITFTHPRLAVLGIEAIPHDVLLRDGEEFTLRLVLPGLGPLSQLFCPAAADTEPTAPWGLVIGRVVEAETREPLAGATVALAWRAGEEIGFEDADEPGADPKPAAERETDAADAVVAARAGWRQARLQAGADGRFAFCSVPLDAELHLQLAHAGAVQPPRSLRLPESGVLADDFAIGLADGTDVMDIATEMLVGEELASRGRGTVTGRVRAAETGEPLVAARVVVDGGAQSGITDRDGRFWISGVPAGLRTLEVDYLGFASRPTRLLMSSGAVVDTDVTVGVEPVPLPDIRVVTQRIRRGRMAEFERRRHRGIGRFVTREEIEQRRPAQLHQLFQGMLGVRVQPCWRPGAAADCYELVSGRRGPSLGGSGSCRMSMYVNGFRWDVIDGIGINEFHPNDIEAIELYSGPASVPARFMDPQSSVCGVVVVWLRTSR